MPRQLTRPKGEERQFEASGQIRQEALKAGCTSMTLISQASGVLSKALADVEKAAGLCRSMSIRWIKGRKSGKNFLSELVGPCQQVNDALVQLMASEYDALGPLGIYKLVAYIKAQVADGSGLATTGAHLVLSASTIPSVGSWFTQNGAQVGIGQLRSVNIFGGYNHAMAMDLREIYAIFFDPNWGEFTFPSHLLMVNFLSQSMFTRYGSQHKYADSVNFNGAVKIGFA